MKIVRIAILGADGAQKGVFIETLTGMKIFSVSYTPNEEFVTHGTTNDRIDATFGRLYVREDLIIDFFSYTPDKDLTSLYAILGNELMGIIVYIDMTQQATIDYAKKIHETIVSENQLPYIIVGDILTGKEPLMSFDAVHKYLELSNDVLVVPCNSTNKDSVKTITDFLFETIKMNIK